MDEWTSRHGVPSRMGELPGLTSEDAYEYVLGRGCGAWVGKGKCDQPALGTCEGGTPLQFATYLSVTVDKKVTLAALCARHCPPRGVAGVTGRIIADMAPEILRDQRREMDKFFRLSGQPPCPRPNLLWPEPEMPVKPGGRYSEAIEEQLARLDFVKHEMQRGSKDHTDLVFLRAAITALSEGETYYWAPDVCRTIVAVGSLMPQTWAFDVNSLPSPAGFFWFKGGLWWRAGDQAVGVDSICWRRGLDQNQKPAAAVGMFMANGQGQIGFGSMTMVQGETAEAMVQEVIDHSADQQTAAAGVPIVLGFAACLTFLQQRILVAPKYRIERHARKRLEHAGFQHEPLVRVVELRRKATASKPSDDAKTVEWSHQWIVGGHWRQQWYPTLERNQPIWIMPHLKGPQDKPLKPPRAKVFAVTR